MKLYVLQIIYLWASYLLFGLVFEMLHRNNHWAIM